MRARGPCGDALRAGEGAWGEGRGCGSDDLQNAYTAYQHALFHLPNPKDSQATTPPSPPALPSLNTPCALVRHPGVRAGRGGPADAGTGRIWTGRARGGGGLRGGVEGGRETARCAGVAWGGRDGSGGAIGWVA